MDPERNGQLPEEIIARLADTVLVQHGELVKAKEITDFNPVNLAEMWNLGYELCD